MTKEILIKLKKLNLDYGSINAIKNFNLNINHSEIHAIVGEHGAGKSSLAMIICGLLKPLSGRIEYQNCSYNSYNFREAKKKGIEIVFQKIQLNKNFTIAENIFFTESLFFQFPFYNRKKLEKKARDFISSYNFNLNPAAYVKDLNQSDRALVSILRSIYKKPKLLILDEALEKLSIFHFNQTVKILKELKNNGLSIIFITHRIDDIYHIADKVSVIKNGELLLTENVNKIDKINLIKFAYTQISKHDNSSQNINKEFYQLLKYNEAILKNLPINLLATNNQNKIKLVNDYALKYFNIKNNSFINLSIYELFKKNNDKILSIFSNSTNKNSLRSFYNFPLILKNKKHVVNIIIYPILDGIMFLGNIIIIEDITEREKIREQLDLSEKLASVGLLAAGVAHEINNPLGIIYNYLESLKYSEDINKRREIINNLYEQFDYITSVIGNLISFSENKGTMLQEIEINSIISSVLSLLKYNAEYKNILIDFTSDYSAIKLEANNNELKQVILNFLKNSFDAMPDGGKINIKTTTDMNSKSSILKIFIKDTGNGIQFDDPNDIFLPFNSTKKESTNNLGLGLFVSYGIIKKYNGDIRINKSDSKGTEFLITIPIRNKNLKHEYTNSFNSKKF